MYIHLIDTYIYTRERGTQVRSGGSSKLQQGIVFRAHDVIEIIRTWLMSAGHESGGPNNIQEWGGESYA